MAVKYDPETGERMFTEQQVREIVREAIDLLRDQTMSNGMYAICNRVHGAEPDVSVN